MRNFNLNKFWFKKLFILCIKSFKLIIQKLAMYTQKQIMVIVCIHFTYNISKNESKWSCGIFFIPSYVIFHVKLVSTKHVTVRNKWGQKYQQFWQLGSPLVGQWYWLQIALRLGQWPDERQYTSNPFHSFIHTTRPVPKNTIIWLKLFTISKSLHT